MVIKKRVVDKISRGSYPNLIIEQILEAIKNGILKPGDALPSETELIQQFNVGRTSVREALAGLEYMDIINMDNGQIIINPDVQSFYMKKLLYHHKLDEKKHEELLEVRRMLETEFVRLAALRATMNDMKRLKQILKAIGNIIGQAETSSTRPSEKQIQEYLKLNIQFHVALAKATQNSMYVCIYEIFKEIMFINAEKITDLEYMQLTHGTFVKVLKYIEERDYQKAILNVNQLMLITKKLYKELDEENVSDKE